MSLAQKLRDRAVDRILEDATGHRFDQGPYRAYCLCGACCLDVLDAYHKPHTEEDIRSLQCPLVGKDSAQKSMDQNP